MIININHLLIISIFLFACVSLFLVVQHELIHIRNELGTSNGKIGPKLLTKSIYQNLEKLQGNLEEIEHAAVPLRSSPNFIPKGREEQNQMKQNDKNAHLQSLQTIHDGEKLGQLKCNGQYTDSEVIYWREVPGDSEYESPITPHHGVHHDRYMTFEYDHGGWNNMRMSIECLIVVAHAMGKRNY